MNKNKKAIIVEALMRIIIMIILIVLVVNIIYKVGRQIGIFGGGVGQESFENLVNEINLLSEAESKQAILYMDEGTAVIGFSKNTKEFRCYGCPQAFLSNAILYSIQKPSNNDCQDKPCICLCLYGLISSPLSGSESKINCERFSCRTLKQDIVPKISLEGALKKRNVQLASYPYWENGFLFVRIKDPETPSNGMPPNSIGRTTLFIEKKKINQENYVGACPLFPCIQ